MGFILTRDKRGTKQVTNSLILVLQLGLNMIIPILLCTGVGYFIASKTDKSFFTIIGILIGIVAGFNGVYRQVQGYLKNPESPGQRARRLEEEAKNDNKMDKEA